MVKKVQPILSKEELTALNRIMDYLSTKSKDYIRLSPEERQGHIFHSVLVLRSSAWFNKTLFDTGQIICTEDATAALKSSYQEVSEFLYRHQTGDWGEVDYADWLDNDYSVEEGLRISSAYRTKAGEELWITTVSDRSFTTIDLSDR